MSVSKQILIATACVAISSGPAWAGASADSTDAEWLPAAQDVATHSNTASVSLPTVPLPSAAYGVLTSLGLIVWLRYSRHRRWITLR